MSILFLILIFILIFLIFKNFVIVPQNHIGIVESFGKFKKTLDPGLHILTPFIETLKTKINLSVQNFFFDLESVTKDKVRVHIKANLIYKVNRSSVTQYFYELKDPKLTLASFVENYSRSYVASQTHEELLEKREDMSDYLLTHLQEKMLKWGIKIIGFQITDIIFPREITDAMSKVVASQRLKEAALNEAEAQKIKIIKQAEAEKESRILLGKGVAGERQAIIEGLKQSIDDMKNIPGLNTHEVMNLIVLSQYFDTIKNIGDSQNTKILFLDSKFDNDSFLKNMISALESVNIKK